MVVYFMQAGLAAPIKIGCTGDIKTRLAAVQQVHFEEVRLLAAAEGCYRVEAMVHAMLAGSRIRGEWYALTLEVAELIGRINNGESLYEIVPPDPVDRYCQSVKCKTCPYAAYIKESGGKIRRYYESPLSRWRPSVAAAT